MPVHIHIIKSPTLEVDTAVRPFSACCPYFLCSLMSWRQVIGREKVSGWRNWWNYVQVCTINVLIFGTSKFILWKQFEAHSKSFCSDQRCSGVTKHVLGPCWSALFFLLWLHLFLPLKWNKPTTKRARFVAFKPSRQRHRRYAVINESCWLSYTPPVPRQEFGCLCC